ncbi:MAG: ComEA family DNA-binding protein [Labilithrix sp.]|nr:ComEA family DNA-binding protein [Labilithrix sp.]
MNHASADELRRLPGVGPKRAEAIVALRQRMGRFQRVEDLLRVKGVGRTTLRKWRPLLRLDAPARREETAAADGGAP